MSLSRLECPPFAPVVGLATAKDNPQQSGLDLSLPRLEAEGAASIRTEAAPNAGVYDLARGAFAWAGWEEEHLVGGKVPGLEVGIPTGVSRACIGVVSEQGERDGDALLLLLPSGFGCRLLRGGKALHGISGEYGGMSEDETAAATRSASSASARSVLSALAPTMLHGLDILFSLLFR
ncbi:hypothetical protein KSP40_PGU008147 [Platanthera guangdongensis]|uniref:Uncharacterized protein n=1 Tax=Platanthera guangdongensis TaxID=2320717 RepID=A0ABR2MG38_9ASPA